MELITYRINNFHLICSSKMLQILKPIYENRSFAYDWFLDKDNPEILRGRKPVLLQNLQEMLLVIKKLSHGGFLSRITGEIFPDSQRLTDTIQATEYLLQNQINTPEVIFGAWKKKFPGVRCEIGVHYIPGGKDASEYFFSEQDEKNWVKKLESAFLTGKFVQTLHKIDFIHPDLNLMNFLILPNSNLYILDLDKASPPDSSATQYQKQANLERLFRSVKKQGKNTDFRRVDQIIEAIQEGYRSN